MIEIELSQGMIALVDDDTAPEILAMKWYAAKRGRTHYAMSYSPSDHGRTLLLHRVILGVPVGVHVDHIDGDGLNNQTSNLRVCTQSENNRNARKSLNRSSRFKGVSWHKRGAKWRAYVKLNYKYKHLGCFASEIDAALAYDRAAIELFGVFAKTNAVLGLL